MLVTPKMVSGLSVAAGSIVPSDRVNLMIVNSKISEEPPHNTSVSDLSTATGPQLGQYGAK